MNPESTNIAQRLHACRQWLKTAGYDGLLLPVTDAYLSEYVPPHAQRLQWLTGFTGSAGLLVLLRERAALCTDGRYTLQAAQQLEGLGVEVVQTPGMHPLDWVQEQLHAGKIGFDPWLHSVEQIEGYTKRLEGSAVALVALPENPVDTLWVERPQPANRPASLHALKYAGTSAGEKQQDILAVMQKKKLDAVLLTAPDSICWLLNIRGQDVPRTPFLLCYAVLKSSGEVTLFANPAQLNDEVRAHLGKQVRVVETAALQAEVGTLQGKRLLLDAGAASYWFLTALEAAGVEIVRGADPCQLPKAIKNPVEIANVQQAHRWDGAALCRFLAWLERRVGHEEVTELSAAQQLKQFRLQRSECVDLSFTTISGSGPNGAIVHYAVTKESNRPLKVGEMYLVDSGGQYREGTTDVTRTIALGGNPTQEQKQRFTQVLKGHIALARVVFPKGTGGGQLDVLARYVLWQDGVDYAHGTGHGVGSYLSVHEGPQRISAAGNAVPLQPGMILSNEPGYYKAGEYGIRIENLVLVQEWQEVEGKPFYCFETLTLAPIDRSLIEGALLSPEEKAWLNRYHARVRAEVMPLLGDKADKAWLEAATRELS